MPDDWFEQNKPAKVAAPAAKTAAPPASGDWFVHNSPTTQEKAPYSGGPQLPEVTNEGIARLGKYLPGALATGAALTQPEFWPALGMAAVGGLAGSVAEQGLQVAAGTEDRPKGFGEFATRAGKEALEQGLYEAGGRLVAKPFEFVASKLNPSRLYQSSLKPSTTLRVPKRNEVIQTGLREGIPTSESGYEKLTSAITDLTKQIDDKIAAKSPDLGAVINPQTVSRRLDALEHFYEKQAAPAEDLAAIRNVREQFLKRHSYEAPYTEIRPGADEAAGQFVPTGQKTTRVYKDMTLAEAQAEKRGTQRFNANKFGERGSARDEAEKSLAYSLKRQISSIFPEIQQLNERDSSMLALEEQLRKYVGRQGNKNVVGLIPAVVAAGGEAAGGGPSGLLTLAVLAVDNPDIKSRLAIALAKASKNRKTVELGGKFGRELPSVGARFVGAQ